MQSRPLGKSGVQASVIGLGTWAIGGSWWGGTDEQDSIAAIGAGIDAGITLIDTAPMYGCGVSEELVGKAIASRRDEIVLATKCGLVWWDTKGDHFFTKGDMTVHKYLGPESIQKEVEDSLKRLGVEAIDLYQTHWQETTTPVADTMAKLMELKAQGKINAIGVSNAQVDHLQQYAAAGQLGTAQEKYSMLDRKLEDAVLPHCNENNIAMLAYSPIELGLLSGKMKPGREFEGDDLRKGNAKFTDENILKVTAMLDEFQPIADGHGLTIAQLVMAWTFHQPGVTHVLVGARNPSQATENAKAGTATLSDDELKTMADIVAKHQPGLA